MVAPDFPEFQPRRFWASADLQTLRRQLWSCRPDLAKLARKSEQLGFPMNDGTGDILLGLYHEPLKEPGRRPIVVVIHGLPGSQDSAVVLHSAAHLLSCGYPVLRLNLRGAGASGGKTKELYHAGRSEDLRRVAAQLPLKIRKHGIAFLAYSLGGNILLKTLGEKGLPEDVRGAAAVSSPIDLENMAGHLKKLRGHRYLLYVWYLLRLSKSQILAVPGLSEAQRTAVREATTFYELDRDFLAGFSGFADAEQYYRQSSSLAALPGIRVPTLVIHAPNDPVVPIGPHDGFDWSSNPILFPLLTAAGGHAGFHGRGSSVAWHDRCVEIFFGRL